MLIEANVLGDLSFKGGLVETSVDMWTWSWPWRSAQDQHIEV